MDNLENVIETDVLVIGGGFAGIFAAVKAKEQGVDVTLVSKGNIGRSGQTPWASSTFVVLPDWEDWIEQFMERARINGEYLNNRDWTERVKKDSYARFNDLISWGLSFLKDDKGDFFKVPKLNPSEIELPHLMWSYDEPPGRWIKPLREQPKKLGVHILEKVMIADLIKQDGHVIGAIGIPTDSRNPYIFMAKSTVICMGAGGFKPVGGWPLGDLTADGQVMAYKAGAEISGKEFEDFHNGMVKKSGDLWLPPLPPMVNVEGNDVPGFGFGLNADIEAHLGKAPLYRGKDEVFSSVALGMSIHTAEGIWPVDENCFSGVPGLYAAGDSCATMVTGATYSILGAGTATASVTGARAGLAAAQYAKQTKTLIIDKTSLQQKKDSIFAPLEQVGGFSPNWVIQLLRNTMMPYFILRVKHGKRLQATLTFIEFMRDHLSPKIYAKDPHELRLAHETKNMIINAEMKLRASLYRTESRGTHYREDFPRRVDPDWLAWVLLKENNGKMEAVKKPIPDEWMPDLSIPYDERYPNKFPGE